MRIVPVPGGTRQQFRAVTMTPPFDLPWSVAVVVTPPITDFALDFDHVRGFTLDFDHVRNFTLSLP